MSTTTLSIKVGTKFAKQFRKFCEENFLQIGKFTEHALTEVIEDYHFGTKAHKILGQTQNEKTPHKKYLED